MESCSGKVKVSHCLMVYCLISEEKYSQGYVIDVGQNLKTLIIHEEKTKEIVNLHKL
jgi:hypothetical protein